MDSHNQKRASSPYWLTEEEIREMHEHAKQCEADSRRLNQLRKEGKRK